MKIDDKKLLDIYRDIAHHYPGGILVADENGKIILTNQSSTLVLPYEQMMNRTLSDLVENKIYGTSSILKALSSGHEESEYIKRKDKASVITTSIPVHNEDGTIRYVIAYTLKKEVAYSLVKRFEEQSNHMNEILDYFSNHNSEEFSLIFADEQMHAVVQYAKQVAATDSIVLLTGESGVGKEVIARFIHSNSNRRRNIFIPCNCAAIPANLMEAEFFGYAKGAFTGANPNGKMGLFELADGGTLFLDEIGELPMELQAKLLRVLDSGEVMRIGSDKIIHPNVRILAATNRNLLQMVGEGTFRQDLYYRLNIIPLHIPPLRQRKKDVVFLAQFFLEKLNQKYGTTKFFSQETLQTLQQYTWPGNVREVKNVVERIYVTSGQILQISFPLSQNIPEETAPPYPIPFHQEGKTLKEAVSNYEHTLIQRALIENGNNVAQTAASLGITRACLYKKLEAMKLKDKD